MTMRELAKIAKVSVSTVSKAFKNAEDVSEETKEHIFAVAREYGCYGKFYKGKYNKKIIAVICPELVSDYYIGYVERLQKLIEENGGIALISAYHFNYTKQAELIEYYASFLMVDGIFVIGLKHPLKKGYDIPIVSLFPASDFTVDSVNIDFNTPIYEAIERLKSLGHKNIAFIGEKLTLGKADAFINAVKNIGDIEYCIIESKYRFEQAGKDGVEKLLNNNSNHFTAIVCAYDYIAIGAIKQLKYMGYSVPKDFSVIGMDNINVSQYIETSLTTIGVNPDEICVIAWDLMEKKIKNKFYRSHQRIIIKGELIVRESVEEAKKDIEKVDK